MPSRMLGGGVEWLYLKNRGFGEEKRWAGTEEEEGEAWDFVGLCCTKKRERKREANIVIPHFVCGWNDVTDHWLLLVSFCCLFHVRRRANSSRRSEDYRPSKCSWPIDGDRPRLWSLGCRRTNDPPLQYAHILPEGIKWLVQWHQQQPYHGNTMPYTSVSNIPGVCVSCRMARVGLPAEIDYSKIKL
jgi:hypothetical protein